METRAIAALEDLAAAYADLRDRRQALTEEEVTVKQRILALMKKHAKEFYRRDGIEIRLVPSAEDVKVKVTKATEEDPEEEARA
jgi:hypothetical protein